MAKRRERRQHVRVDHPGGEEGPIRFELFSTERLEQHAVSLAKAQKVSSRKEGQKLIPRVRENCRVLLDAYEAVANEVRLQHAITPAAEWLLDNFHVIEEQISNIHVDLPENLLPGAAQVGRRRTRRLSRASTASPGHWWLIPTAASTRSC